MWNSKTKCAISTTFIETVETEIETHSMKQNMYTFFQPKCLMHVTHMYVSPCDCVLLKRYYLIKRLKRREYADYKRYGIVNVIKNIYVYISYD